MLTRPIKRPIVAPLTRALTAAGGGGSAPFNPADLMAANTYWWDASDATTITKNGSDQVSQLADKSGNANHLTQSVDADKPLANISMNGVACIDCRPDLFMLPTANPFVFGPREVFAVLWSERAAAGDNAFVLTMPGGSTTNTTIGTAKIQFGGSSLNGSDVTRGNGTMRHTLIQHSYIEATGATTQYMYIDGRLRSGAVTTTAVGGTRAAFANSAGAAPLNGLFAEMLVFNRTLSAGDRTNVINYLTNKWRAITPVSKYHVVLLAGQSNMRGSYGNVNLTTDATDPRIAMLERTYNPSTGVVIEDDAGPIVLAEHPLSNRWRDTASPPGENTVGPGLAYAKALLATLPSDEGVLLVPCAQGSTYVMDDPPLSPDVTWSPTPAVPHLNTPLGDSVARMNRMLALTGQTMELHSLFWCQGESDATQTMSEAVYSGYSDAVFTYLRANITGATNLPIVSVQIGHFLNAGTYPSAVNINASIADLPNRLANTAYVDTTAETSGGDGLHYSAASSRSIGTAGFTAYQTI